MGLEGAKGGYEDSIGASGRDAGFNERHGMVSEEYGHDYIADHTHSGSHRSWSRKEK